MARHPTLAHRDDTAEHARDLGPLQGRRRRAGKPAGARDAGPSPFAPGPGADDLRDRE